MYLASHPGRAVSGIALQALTQAVEESEDFSLRIASNAVCMRGIGPKFNTINDIF